MAQITKRAVSIKSCMARPNLETPVEAPRRLGRASDFDGQHLLHCALRRGRAATPESKHLPGRVDASSTRPVLDQIVPEKRAVKAIGWSPTDVDCRGREVDVPNSVACTVVRASTSRRTGRRALLHCCRGLGAGLRRCRHLDLKLIDRKNISLRMVVHGSRGALHGATGGAMRVGRPARSGKLIVSIGAIRSAYPTALQTSAAQGAPDHRQQRQRRETA